MKAYIDLTKAKPIYSSTHPSPPNFNRGSLKAFPEQDSNLGSGKAFVLRGYGLNSIDLKDRVSDLMYSDFDGKTVWPNSLPDKFNPEGI